MMSSKQRNPPKNRSSYHKNGTADQNLGVIDDWLKDIDDFFAFTYATTVYTVLKENENRSYDLLLGLYRRLEYIVSEIKSCR